MAVPAHDQRDFDFARQYGLAIIPVIQPEGERAGRGDDGRRLRRPRGHGQQWLVQWHAGDGGQGVCQSVDVAPWPTGWPSAASARKSINYRLRDWLISRQRYWGAPIPAVYRRLTARSKWFPTRNCRCCCPMMWSSCPPAKAHCAIHQGFLHTTDADGRPARRETDTMDTFMCSSWYQYRYLSPTYDRGPFDPEEAAYWLPVDVYTGGRGARHDAPALYPLLHQGHARPGSVRRGGSASWPSTAATRPASSTSR
jgi:leucyl-tRNA synthetase